MKDEDGEQTLVSQRVREKAERVLADFHDPDDLPEVQVVRAVDIMVKPEPPLKVKPADKVKLLAGLQEQFAATDDLVDRIRAASVDDCQPGWRTRLVHAVLRASVRAQLARVPTWFWEQAVLTALLALTLWRQGTHATSVREMLPAVYAAVGVLVAQKVRSIADRQREANARAGVRDEPVRCADAQAFYGSVAQALSLLGSIAAATVWPQVLVALYGCLYPLWRRWYRARQRTAVIDLDVGGYARLLQTEQSRRSRGADLLRRLADTQSVVVVRVDPSFACEEELAAWIARDVHRDGAASVLVAHTTVREGAVVQGLAASKLGVDHARLTVVRNHAPLYAAFDRAYLVVEQAEPDPTPWVRLEVLTHLRAGGRVVVLWTALGAPPPELQDVGCSVDLRAETTQG